VALILAVAACDGGSSNVTGPSKPTRQFGGLWSGQIIVTNLDDELGLTTCSAPSTVALVQSDLAVTGDLRMETGPCFLIEELRLEGRIYDGIWLVGQIEGEAGFVGDLSGTVDEGRLALRSGQFLRWELVR